ncbi:Gamma-aminobutyric acid type B receptor subunit 2 [Holothuria leucospilota]|uniref:Gamma-aminobutyric acid type B receptor subunit 2 n=1 Tax=Holothuria leucospilota TaxID=206669 RepID=A0A9Q0YKK5_HOLLE|nr:Gamma-aminobutyric acid type B receptor subunit 2 [Holothuria leucospilota]
MQSTITEALAEVTGIWKIIQVNQASSSPNLSNRRKYPYFFRSLGPPYNLNDLQSIMLKEFNWTKVAVLHEGKQPHSGVTDHLQQILYREGFSILATESFYNDPSDAMKRLKTPEEFRKTVSSRLGYEVTIDSQDVTALSYDIVWALAVGLNSSIERISPKNLSEFNYFDETMANIFRDGIENASFYGASVRNDMSYFLLFVS